MHGKRFSVRSMVLAAGLAACGLGGDVPQARAHALAGMAQPASFVKPEDRNAALRYWQVFGFWERDLDEKSRAVDWDAIGDAVGADKMPPSFRAVFEGAGQRTVARMSAEELVRASRMRVCNFEVDYEEGPAALLPHLGRMRVSARLLRVWARDAANAGNAELAGERVAAIVRMGEHASREPIVICSLVGVAMIMTGLEEAQSLHRAGALSAAARREIALAIEGLDDADPVGLRRAIEGERDIFLPWIERCANDPQGMKRIAELVSTADDNKAQIEALLARGREAVLADAQCAREAFDRVLAAWNGPDAAAARLDVERRIDAGEFGVLARSLTSDFGRTIDRDRELREQIAQTLMMMGAE
jgi:hypothetical protein